MKGEMRMLSALLLLGVGCLGYPTGGRWVYARPQYPSPYDLDLYYPVEAPPPYYGLPPYLYPPPYPAPYYPSVEDTLDHDLIEEEDTLDADKDIPYGQETWYETARRQEEESNAETNAIFLQNLMLAEMYKEAAAKGGQRYPVHYPDLDYNDEGYVYGEPVQTKQSWTGGKDDEEVKELKSLMVGDKRRKEGLFAGQVRRGVVPGKRADTPREGQEEVVLPRPPSPPHHTPSVYDNIKKLLHMQDQLHQKEESSRPQKRSYTSSEESLVEQLGSLKKSA